MKTNRPTASTKVLPPSTEAVAEKPSTVRHAEPEEIERYKLRERLKPNTRFETVAEKLAGSSTFYRNRLVPQLEEAFPGCTIDWTVALYFPFAEGGPLHVDEPRFGFDVDRCRAKAEVMRKAGLRYVYLQKGDKVDVGIMQLEGKLK